MSIALIIILGVLVIGAVVGVWMGAEFMVRPERRVLEKRHHDVLAEPAEFGMKLHPFEVSTKDGFSLKAFLAHPETKMGDAERTRRMQERLEKSGVPATEKIRGTVVFLHGRGGLKENMLTVAQRFVAANFRCIVYDARAHGQSEGHFSTFGHLEKDDLGCVIDHVETMLVEQGTDTGPIVGFGLSLGAAVLLQSLEHERRIELGIAVAPFADLHEEIHFTGQKMAFNSLPPWVTRLVANAGGSRAGFDPSQISPLKSAANAEIPVFLVHGKHDGVIPIEHSHRIFQNLPHPGKVWREIPDAYHWNVLAEGGDDVYQEMIEFCLKHLD